MEDGEGVDLDLSSLPSSCSMDSFFDEILKADTHACTHTHTCNAPSGPAPSPHTHTCFHVHTKILSSSSPVAADDTADSSADTKSKKQQQHRPFGNREAVRKYREKKKARAASLEDEVVQLRSLNKQLMKRLQNQAALEAEVARLRCLLVDIRGRIEGEIGSFPYQKPPPMMPAAVTGNPMLGACGNLRCDDDRVYCVGGVGEVGAAPGCGSAGCDIGDVRCMGSSSSGSKEFFACGVGNGNGGMADIPLCEAYGVDIENIVLDGYSLDHNCPYFSSSSSSSSSSKLPSEPVSTLPSECGRLWSIRNVHTIFDKITLAIIMGPGSIYDPEFPDTSDFHSVKVVSEARHSDA